MTDGAIILIPFMAMVATTHGRADSSSCHEISFVNPSWIFHNNLPILYLTTISQKTQDAGFFRSISAAMSRSIFEAISIPP